MPLPIWAGRAHTLITFEKPHFMPLFGCPPHSGLHGKGLCCFNKADVIEVHVHVVWVTARYVDYELRQHSDDLERGVAVPLLNEHSDFVDVIDVRMTRCLMNGREPLSLVAKIIL